MIILEIFATDYIGKMQADFLDMILKFTDGDTSKWQMMNYESVLYSPADPAIHICKYLDAKCKSIIEFNLIDLDGMTISSFDVDNKEDIELYNKCCAFLESIKIIANNNTVADKHISIGNRDTEINFFCKKLNK